MSDRDAALWAAAFDEHPASPLTVRSDQPVAITQPAPWQEWFQGQFRIRYGTAVATGLSPRSRYSFSLVRDGNVVAQASLTTLPEEMPSIGNAEKPFTVLLASCFSRLEDRQTAVGNTFFQMPAPARPDIKLLSGDQVYLDSPWQRFSSETHSATQLRNIFLAHYTRTWGQTDGFARLLGEGANYFCSADHEYWNNAPNRAAHIQDTWPIIGNRQIWWDTAADLYRVFQTDQTVTSFSVPPVSFLIADTRINRSSNRTTFMLPQDLQRVRNWVDGLRGPGVLVIGQPLLQTSTGFFKGHFGDWNLPDFEQYQELTQIVAKATRSLVI